MPHFGGGSLPGLNIFIMPPPQQEVKETRLMEMLKRKRKEEMHKEAIEKMETISRTVATSSPTSHMGGG